MKPLSHTDAGTHQDWSGLRSSQSVVVKEHTGEPYAATVDVITDDSAVVWVIADGNYQRKAFDYREGVHVSAT